MRETSEEPLDLAGPDPRARALRWYLDHLRAGFRDATEEDVRARHRSDDPIPPAQRIRADRAHTERLTDLAFERAFATTPHEGVARLRDATRRAWRLRAMLHPPEPERLRWAVLTMEPPPGVSIRFASPADGAALADLERRVPVVDGEVRRSYDRGADYFAATAVADEHETLVAEVDGVLRGMVSHVYHSARTDGRLLRVCYLRHARVDPSAQGGGVNSSLTGASAERGISQCDAPWSLTAVHNAAVNRLGFEHVARGSALQLRIDTRAAAEPGPLRTASAADAATLASLLERATGHLELARPWTAADVTQRMTGAGRRYGWERIAFTESVLLGVERSGVRVISEGPAGREERREALACDVAALPGREAELLPLLHAWCARLADEAIDDLLVTLASRSLIEALGPLASRTIAFNLNYQFVVAPDAAARGYFIDGMLF